MVTMQKVYVFLIEILIVRCVLSDGTYECGKNGRFEYCIDEFPGCVVGCHCHPGYYFDTDTKICEPNTKLIEHHRKHNIIEPTRAKAQASFTTDSYYTTANPIDVEIGEISKDADNLGDWLYNQFFKTIENQVINSTKEDKPKRRSGGGSLSIKMPKQSKRKNNKMKFSKKRNKKAKLKKKIKRISEDHSMFNDGSSSDSDSESDSSASSSSNDKSENSDSKEHGHKKIVLFQKKPKRPLPSFIFLPNMDTPYYPPLGLPPPPVMPMYPAVPVPPMLPVFPYPALTTCRGENKGEDKVTTESSLPASSSKTPDNVPDNPNTPSTHDATGATDASEASTDTPEGQTEVTDKPPDNSEKSMRHRIKNKKRFPGLPGYQDRKLRTLGLRINSLTPMARQKMLHQLKHKMKGASPNMLMPPWKNVDKFLSKPKQQPVAEPVPEPMLEPEPDYLAEAMPEPMPEVPVMQDNVLPEELAIKNINPSQMQKDDSLTDNVSFKYISQLIHKENISNNFAEPPIEFNPNNFKDNKNMINFNTPYNAAHLRRKYKEFKNTNKDDTYFSKLGKQIASLIRNLDTDKQQIKIEVEETKPTYAHSPYFNYNSPRSFWERSVRSPLNLANTQHSKFEYLKKSNEVLFNIENKVEILASTSHPLNLQEMENIVNMMEMAKRNIVNKEKALSPLILDKPSKNLNVNLWPKELHRFNLSPTPVPEIIHENRQIIPDKPESHTNNIRKILAWQKMSRPDKNHIGHVINSNSEPTMLNNRLVNNQREAMGDKQIHFIRNTLNDHRLHAAIPNQRNGNIYLTSNKLTNIESIFLNRHPNSRKFYQQPSYFDGEIGHYGFYN